MPDVLLNRAVDFDQIARDVPSVSARIGDHAIVTQGDSLQLLSTLPDQSVSLIVTDPPYHSTKKANIVGDRDFSSDDEYVAWLELYAHEWQRILKPCGSLYLFCASEMAAQIEVRLGKLLLPLNHITWTKPNDPGFDGWKGKMQKEALRRWYPHSERILFFSQADDSHVRRSPLGTFLREARQQARLSGHKLTELVGAYGRVNHGGAVSNWETGRNIPSYDQYQRIRVALENTGRVTEMPAYEDIVRPFRVSRDVPFVDVWDFPSVRMYKGKHPAEKPVDLLRHIIQASSYEGDIVLDCFCGSGATLEAALSCNRRAIGFEIEQQWAEQATARAQSTRGASDLGDVDLRHEVVLKRAETSPAKTVTSLF